LKPAIEEFVGMNVEWVVEKEIKDGNGLTVLARRK
jgi:hypothetical protein